MADPRLRVRDPLVHESVTISHVPFTIGRRETNSLRLGSTEVSREHAEIVEEGGRYRLRDRQSRYGTFVNGEAVAECELRSGDEIRLGRSGGAELVFLQEGDDDSRSGDSTPHSLGGMRLLTVMLERLRALGSGRVLQDVLALVLDSAIEIARADRGFIMLATPDGDLEFRLARGPGGRTLTDLTFGTSRRIPLEVFRTGRTRVERDLQQRDIAPDHPHTIELGIRHVICVPLNLVQFVESEALVPESRRVGVLYLDGRGKGTLVSDETRSALETLAAEASTAIENARLYRIKLEQDQDMRLAARIQQELLPHAVVRLPYVDAAATTLPCRSIGGDFFDYLAQTETVFGFTLGDVAGKGPSAALLSAMMQGMFAFVSQGPYADSPATIVARIDRALGQRRLESRFVTLLFGVLTIDGRLTYCNAGHNPPFVVGAAGVRRLDAGGPIVGLLPFASYEQETVALGRGDMIVAFSDGVSEALNAAGDEFGESRLLEAIERTGTADAQAMIDGVVDAVRAFTKGAVQSDDITIMAVRYLGGTARA